MMPSERFREILSGKVMPKMAAAMDYTSTDVAARIEDSISIPVAVVNGKVIRSRPGQAPRTETGRLLAGVGNSTDIDTGALTVTSSVFTKRDPGPGDPSDVAVRLELGIGVMPRPFMRPGMTNMKEQIGPDIEREFA